MPMKKSYSCTSQENRGGWFFDKMRYWQILHEDAGRTVFTKTMLAERFHAWDDLRIIGEAEKKAALRAVEALKNFGVPIFDCDKLGTPLDDDQREDRQTLNPFAQRFWKYDPTGHWASQLDRLADEHQILGCELVGFLACEKLLADLRGLPAQQGVQTIVNRMRRLIPEALYAEAVEQSRTWFYGLTTPTKYASRKKMLARWHEAAIRRHQVLIHYRTPGTEPRGRRVAALGARFDREEDSVYLLGAERQAGDPHRWGHPVQWKLDRVTDIRPLGEPNPPPTIFKPHRNVLFTKPGAASQRLDLQRLYSDSASCYLRYGTPTIRLVVVVTDPQWIAWCRERPFHPLQQITLEPVTGGFNQLRLTIDRCHEDEVFYRLLRLGAAFTVIEPQSLRVRIANEAAAIAERHLTCESSLVPQALHARDAQQMTWANGPCPKRRTL
jgi:predicted DNA-binding transcriptional regulator YafY